MGGPVYIVLGTQARRRCRGPINSRFSSLAPFSLRGPVEPEQHGSTGGPLVFPEVSEQAGSNPAFSPISCLKFSEESVLQFGFMTY